MKKLFLIPFCLFIRMGSILAQSSIDDEISLVQSAFGKDKKMIVEAFMDLPESVAPSFWSVYEEYESERQALSRERIKLINDYLENYDNIDEELATSLATSSLKNDVALSKLHQKYFKKFKKVTSAVDAAKFLQVDTYIHNTIRNAMQQELPFIGEY